MGGSLHIVDAGSLPEMLRQAAVLRVDGDRVVSVGPGPADSPLPLTDGCVHRPMGVPEAAGWRMRRLAGGADLLHAWSMAALRAGRELSLATGVPLMASLPAAPRGADLARLRDLVGPGLLHVTVPTRAARAALVAAALPPGFVHVLPPAATPFDIVRQPSVRSAVRAALGFADDELVLVVPEAMVPAAGHDVASWSHATARKVIGGLRLLLLPGGGPNEQRVRFFANTTGHGHEAVFTGRSLALAGSLAAGDVALVLHRRAMGVGALPDAMAAGLAVVASATPDLAECVTHDADAILVEPSSSRETAAGILRLADSLELRQRLGEAARRKAQRAFDASACRERLAELRSLVLSRSQAPQAVGAA
jgi:hypothetical protein